MITKVSVVIPVWNGKTLLEKNLPSILEAAKNPNNKISEIILIDDKSKDDSVEFLKNNFGEDIKLVCNKKNRGFSTTVNTGFRTAKSGIVCLLNQDVEVNKDFLENVLPHFKDKKVFGVSLHEEGFSFTKGVFTDGFIAHKSPSETGETSNTFWVSGGSGVFSRKTWMELGGLDEKILPPFYWEDVDISYRALKRGYKLLWEPKAKVFHNHESVINKNNFKKWKLNLIKERNYLLFNWKNLTSHNLFRKHIRGLINRTVKHPGYLKVVIFALFKLRLIMKSRKKEKKEALLSDEAIFASFT